MEDMIFKLVINSTFLEITAIAIPTGAVVLKFILRRWKEAKNFQEIYGGEKFHYNDN